MQLTFVFFLLLNNKKKHNQEKDKEINIFGMKHYLFKHNILSLKYK